MKDRAREKKDEHHWQQLEFDEIMMMISSFECNVYFICTFVIISHH